MSQETIAKTIQLLGQIIQKPPLNQKLLSRPPFRYIHDIFSEIINNTGYYTGLYTDEEMMSENVKEKEAKVSYLNKMIQTLEYINGAAPPVDSYKVIAGMDSDATNILLQMVAEAVIKNLPFESAVRKTLNLNQSTQIQTSKREEITTNHKVSVVGTNEKTVPKEEKKETNSIIEKADTISKNNDNNESISQETEKKTILKDVTTTDSVNNLKEEDSQIERRQDSISNLQLGRLTRPMTARAPPPKVKKPEIVQETVLIPATAILKEEEVEEDDGSYLAFEAAENEIPTQESDYQKVEQGGLVSKLLQAKKDLEGQKNGNSNSEIEDSKKVISPQEIEVIRQSIQLLCKSTHPLGKMVDYIQEDMDGMSKELIFWKKEAVKYEKKLKDEMADFCVGRDENHQKLDKIIDEQMEKIRILKGDILRKDLEITKHLSALSKPILN